MAGPMPRQHVRFNRDFFHVGCDRVFRRSLTFLRSSAAAIEGNPFRWARGPVQETRELTNDQSAVPERDCARERGQPSAGLTSGRNHATTAPTRLSTRW
jgi:hypothetical protein